MIELAIMIEGQNAQLESLEKCTGDRRIRSPDRMLDHYTNANPPDMDSLEMGHADVAATHTTRIQLGSLVTHSSSRR